MSDVVDADGAARVAFVRAYDTARAAGDVEAMGAAALGLAAGRMFGTHPGRAPAFLYEAYTLAEGPLRIRLAVALTRSWVYGGSTERAVPFAQEAVALAMDAGDSALLADALDAHLLVHWGPDDQAERLAITAQLEDTVAHLSDVEARMSAYLWRLTTAMECLDMATMRRQIAALELLADESASDRVLFFTRARQAMVALLDGEFDLAEQLRDEAVAAGERAGEADAFAIRHALTGAVLRQRGDKDNLVDEGLWYEKFGNQEGVLSIVAEGGQMFRVAGERARCVAIAEQFADPSRIPRDMDWLLTVCMITDVAAGSGLDRVTATYLDVLTPYAGRGLVNAGGVSFHGVVDSYLAFACVSLGRTDEAARWSDSAARLYQRFGASWWQNVGMHPVDVATNAPTFDAQTCTLKPGTDGVWLVGHPSAATPIREMRGFTYLRLLLRQPGVEISALDLSDWVSGHPGSGVDESSVGQTLDAQALSSYRRRIRTLDAELAEADDWADLARMERLRAERSLLLDEIAAATGLGGRLRQTGSSAERARVAVRKAVAAAIERIAVVDPGLARHLRDGIQTGAICRYEPDPTRPMVWVTE